MEKTGTFISNNGELYYIKGDKYYKVHKENGLIEISEIEYLMEKIRTGNYEYDPQHKILTLNK